jgi:hypothetical protein
MNLPTFCYRCGIIGHNGNECIAECGGSRVTVFDRDQYGSWLQALPIRSPQFGRQYEDAVDCGSSDAQPQQTEFRGGWLAQGVALHEPPYNEATSSANHGIQNPNDLDSVTASVEAVEAKHDILHVPTFMEVQVNLNASGTAGVYAPGSANLVMGAIHPNNLRSGLSEESQFTATTADEGSGFLVVVDVMPDRSTNHPDQIQRNSRVPDGGSVLSATIGEHGGGGGYGI